MESKKTQLYLYDVVTFAKIGSDIDNRKCNRRMCSEFSYFLSHHSSILSQYLSRCGNLHFFPSCHINPTANVMEYAGNVAIK